MTIIDGVVTHPPVLLPRLRRSSSPGFLTEEGVAEVHDFMPLVSRTSPDHRQYVVRRVTACAGA